MRIGYLHIGAVEHGVVRYGHMIADEVKKHADITVIEAELQLTGEPNRDCPKLIEVAQKLSQADVVHLQYNAHIWGGRDYQLQSLRWFFQNCSSRRVATLHDIFYPPSSKQLWQGKPDEKRTFYTLRSLPKAVLREQFSPAIRALHKVSTECDLSLVCTQTELERLDGYLSLDKVKVLPHFVETRNLQISSVEARKQLGLDGKIVISLLGFIYRGKGHDLLVKALRLLPQNCIAIFVGGLGHQDFLDAVIELAEREGVRDRIEITGYLPEEKLELYLAATHLAVCPFERTSASGSLSTWISVNRIIIASSLPQLLEYNQLQPEAIRIFEPYTPAALATAIQQAIPPIETHENQAVSLLRQQLEVPVVAAQHISQYRALLT
jgi:glycosyltransferase involved in cell wall biosynthesis